MKRQIVNIQQYGDFGMPYTVVSMLAPIEYSRKPVSLHDLTLKIKSKCKNTNEVIAELKTLGFDTLNWYDIIIDEDE